jgi:Ca2+-transporting ATPase
VGDLICLSAGDIVPCDGRLIEDNNLVVLESGITAASAPVQKDSSYQNIRNILPHEALNLVYASTIVRSGHGKAIACRCGKDAYVCTVGKNKSAVSYDKLEIFDTLQRLSFGITLAAIALTFFLTVLNMLPAFNRFDALDGLLYALSYGCAAMTEFYAIFGYILVAVGVFGSLNQKRKICTGALIKNTEKLDKMRKVTTVLLPPEAVLSQQDISLDCLYLACEDDRSCEIGEFTFDPIYVNLLRYAVISTGLYGHRLIDLNLSGDNVYSCQEDAIIRAAKNCGCYNRELHEEYPMREHLPKGEFCPFETTLIRIGQENRVVVRGNSDQILSLCTSYRTKDGRLCKMSQVDRSRFSTIAIQMMREKGTVLAVATNYSVYNTLIRLSDTLSGMTFEGFLGFNEPLLPGVYQTVQRLQNAGIQVKLFTDDFSERNIQLARMIGIWKEEDPTRLCDREELEQMGDRVFLSRQKEIVLFQNMNAKSEKKVITLMQQAGEKVAFLGQNFEEIVALRQADVSYTQSLTLSDRFVRKKNDTERLPLSVSKAGDGAPGGCDALRFVSDVIVSVVSKQDSFGGLNAVAASIERAKVIYRNIERLLTYLLTVNASRLLLLLWIFFTGTTILTPVQLLISGLIFDLGAVMIIAFEKPDRDILLQKNKSFWTKSPLAANLSGLITGVFLGILLILTGTLLQKGGIVSKETVCTPIFAALLFSDLIILLESGREKKLICGNLVLSNMFLTSFLCMLLLFVIGLLFPTVGSLYGVFRTRPWAYLGSFAVVLILLLFLELQKKRK